MTDTEIRKTAMSRLANNSGECVSLMVFQFSVIALIVLSETMLYLSLQNVGYDWLYSLDALMSGKGSTWLFWISKTAVEYSLATPCFSLVRRLYVDVAVGSDMIETRQYINAHSIKFYSRAFRASLVQFFIKLTAVFPGLLSAYGVYHFAMQITLHELTSRALFALSACLSITAVWLYLTVHYLISLAMTPYIMSLNPRSNVFDACDLSVRLMDGKHTRYLIFLLHFAKFLPSMLLVYPFFAIYPYFKVSYSLFMYELMGDKNHDKMPGMIKRWKKYL